MLKVIAFDADDTLWDNEPLYAMTQQKFKQLLSAYHDQAWIEQQLLKTEMRNLEYFGYGIKGFTLSMIETAIELSEGRISGSEIQQIIDFAKAMLRSPVQVLDHAQQTIAHLAANYQLMLITKGDLFDQESKIAQSGLGDYFTHVEIVSQKNRETYQAILSKHRIAVNDFLMVGNSLRSDVLPVVALGARAVYIPYHTTWAHEAVNEHENPGGYLQLEHIGLLPALVEQLNGER